jgi:hypothetical protein
MAFAGDYNTEDGYTGNGLYDGGQRPAPVGYHYDEQGNLVPDAPSSASGAGPITDWQNDPRVNLPGHQSPPGYHWDPHMAMDVPDTPAGGSTTTGGGDGGTGGSSIGSLISPFVGTAPALPGNDTSWLPSLPEFHAPKYTAPAPFAAPTGESVLNEPGFKFGMDEGLQGLQQSAAARGVLNGGGTLKDIAAWGQNYAGTKYNDAYGREASTYDRNVLNQNVLPYQYAFQGAQAEFAPKMQGYATQAAAGQRANEFGYNSAMDQYKTAYDQWLANQQLLYNYRAPFLQG